MKKMKIVILILLVLTSCSEEVDPNYSSIEDMNPVVIDGVSIVETSIIQSESYKIVLKMKITKKDTNEVIPFIFHKFVLDDKNENINILANDLSSVNGEYTIESEGQILYKMIIKNGKIVSKETIVGLTNSFARMEYPCTWAGMDLCANDTLNGMNWIELGACIVTAGECLGVVFASCAWENC